MPQFTKEQKIIIGAVVGVVLFFALVFIGIIPGLKHNNQSVNLTVWGVDDPSSVWQTSIKNFQQYYPGINITYTEVNDSDYESKLINALAAGDGPDIFFFNNSWVPSNGDKVVPALTTQAMSTSTFTNLFPQIASQDFINGENIYAMPLSVDTLGLIYNKTIFDQDGIAVPPATWSQFEKVVKETRVGTYGDLIKPAVAMGGTLNSMTNSTDILNLLFLQEGTEMLDPTTGEAAFSGGEGTAALAFYTQFATPGSAYYTWNDSLNALNSFAQGKSAMFIGYASQISQIKAINPDLNIGVSTVPQFNTTDSINYPNYWGLAVSKQSQNQSDAWEFVKFVTTDPTTAASYATASGRPPALNSLIAQYENNSTFGPYASQALTAQDWVEPNSDTVSTIFSNMIKSVITQSSTVGQALLTAELSVNSLIIPQQ